MPKRLCNSRGRTQARFGRVRIGWKKQRMLNQLEKMDEAVRAGKVEDEMLEKYNEFKDNAKRVLGKLMPKRIFRHQSR